MAEPVLERRLDRLQQEGRCCVDLAGAVRCLQEASIEADAQTFAALGDPHRLRMVRLLASRPGLCGCEFQAALGLTHATVSHHAKKLAAAGLIHGEKRGKWTRYYLTRSGERWAR